MKNSPFSVDIKLDWEGLVNCILRKGTPSRVYAFEFFLDEEIQDAICKRFDLLKRLDPNEKFFACRREIALRRFLGYDCVGRYVQFGLNMPTKHIITQDTAALPRARGRNFMEEHRGPITNWEEFERYPWPDTNATSTEDLEWLQENLPDDMCIFAVGGAHLCEYLCWLMGYETLCYSLYDQRDLVAAIRDKLSAMYRILYKRIVEFDRVKLVSGSDDMGFKTGTLISPADLREFVLPCHKEYAQTAHGAGRPYLLHSCGNLTAIMDDLIDDVGIDARHSFEDAIEDVITAKQRYGHRIALLGGIDMDFLCRATQEQVRKRVRETLEKCMPGGGYCLGTGNSVANYIPLENYLAMLDEGRLWAS